MDAIDDTDFRSQRISLMILSIAIIMYVIGDGSIGTKSEHSTVVAIFGGTINFDNPDIIIWTGFFLYLWFNWMLILSSKSHINIFLLNFKYYLYSSREYEKLATEFVNKLSPALYSGFDVQNHLAKSVIYNHGDVNQRLHQLPPLLTNILYPNTLFFNKNGHQIVDWDKGNHVPWKRIKQYPVPHSDEDQVITKYVPLLKMYWLELTCLHRAILFHKPFAFVIAPFLLSFSAACVLLWDFGMSGILSVIDWLIVFFNVHFKTLLLIPISVFILRVVR